MLLSTSLSQAIGLTCSFFLLTGFASLCRPKAFGVSLGLDVIGDAGFNEVRAQYGGFFLVAGGANVLVLLGHIADTSGIILNIVIFGGLFFGRLASIGLGDDFSTFTPTIKVLYLVDGVGLVTYATFAALR